jgi:hypothetical protein
MDATEPVEPLVTPPGDDLSATITALRTQIAALQADITSLAAAPVPPDEAEVALVAAVDQLGALFNPDPVLASFTLGGADLGMVELLVPPAGEYETQRAAAFTCVVHRDALLSVLRARLQQLYAANPVLARTAISLADRPARLRHLRERLYRLELDEERAILAAEHAGAKIDRREDCDPAVLFDAAVLG